MFRTEVDDGAQAHAVVTGLHGDGGEEIVNELVLAGFFASVCGFEMPAEACEYV